MGYNYFTCARTCNASHRPKCQGREHCSMQEASLHSSFGQRYASWESCPREHLQEYKLWNREQKEYIRKLTTELKNLLADRWRKSEIAIIHVLKEGCLHNFRSGGRNNDGDQSKNERNRELHSGCELIDAWTLSLSIWWRIEMVPQSFYTCPDSPPSK